MLPFRRCPIRNQAVPAMMNYQPSILLQRRPTTPDSACEQDWTPRTGMDSDLSESNYSVHKTSSHNKLYPSTTAGGLTNDSDGDSGIVTVRHSQRTGSTSSTDTETSQENASRSLGHLTENNFNIVLRKGALSKPNSNGPIKGDHSILTGDNTAKLSIFQPKEQTAGAQQLVRFDDELQLTEQSIRRSCRKLFAALYAQKHSIQTASNHMPACQHRISVNIPVTNSSYPCCRSHYQTLNGTLSNKGGAAVPQNPAKIRSNSLSETRRQSNSDIYKMCQNIYSQADRNPDMVQVFARPVAVIPIVEPKTNAVSVPSEDAQSGGACELRTSENEQHLKRDVSPEDEKRETENFQNAGEFSKYYSVPQDCRVQMGTPKSVSMPQLQVHKETSTHQESTAISEVEYAVVDKTKKLRKNELHAISHPCLSRSMMEDVEPPVPPKKFLHRSDFALYQGPNTKKSLLNRIHGFTKNAKSALQKAFSTERIYRPQQEEQLDISGRKKRGTFIKGLKHRVSTRNKKAPNIETVRIESTSNSPLWGMDGTDGPQLDHVCGQLIQLNVDGSQVIELTRPQGKPFGFFVARGRVKNSKGVFVSRMRDPDTQKLLSGLVDVGDEILEIDGTNVKDADILEVNGLMAKKLTLLLTILPYICRKDI